MELKQFKSLRELCSCWQHAELLDYWLEKCASDHVPTRAALDPVEIPRLLPYVNLYDVIWNGGGEPHFRFRLVGTNNVDLYGRDATGRSFEDAYKGETLNEQIQVFSEVAKAWTPILDRRRLPIEGRDFINYERLLLPLSSDGETVDMIIGCMVAD